MDLSKESFLVRGTWWIQIQVKNSKMVGGFGTSSFNKLLFVYILGENVKMHTNCQHSKELWKSNQLLFLCINHFVSTCILFPRLGTTKFFSICDSCVLLVMLYPLVFCFQGGARWRFLAFVVIVIKTSGSLFSLCSIMKLFVPSCKKLLAYVVIVTKISSLFSLFLITKFLCSKL